MKWKNTWFSASHSCFTTPVSTSTPRRRRMHKPFPPTKGFGSSEPTTTLEIPASKIASVQGGCLPSWQQGSSVTYNVAPSGDSPQQARASRSACSPPHRR